MQFGSTEYDFIAGSHHPELVKRLLNFSTKDEFLL